MTAGCKSTSGWLSPRAVPHPLPFPGESILPFSRQLACPGPRAARGGQRVLERKPERAHAHICPSYLLLCPPGPQTQMFSLLFPFFSHSPPEAQCCLPNSAFLARTAVRQDRRGPGSDCKQPWWAPWRRRSSMHPQAAHLAACSGRLCRRLHRCGGASRAASCPCTCR